MNEQKEGGSKIIEGGTKIDDHGGDGGALSVKSSEAKFTINDDQKDDEVTVKKKKKEPAIIISGPTIESNISSIKFTKDKEDQLQQIIKDESTNF